MRIGIIHATMNSVAPMTESFASLKPGITALHFLNENMLVKAAERGGVEASTMRMFARLVFEASEAEVDGIIVACSLWCPFVRLIEHFVDVPVVAVNLPMLEAAVAESARIGIIATNAQSGVTTQKQLGEVAAQAGKQIETEVEAVPDAWKALQEGDVELHNRMICQAGERLAAKNCGAILLSQISMAGAARQMRYPGVKVFTTPDEGAKKILELIKSKK